MKKTILSLVVLFCTMTSVDAQQLLKGDMNDDGDLTIGDVTALVEMIKNEERVYIDTSIGMFEPDNTTLYGTWETADHESIVIFDETGAVYNNKKYSYQYYPNLQKLVLSDTESGLTKVMLFVEKKSDTEISIFDNKIADFVLYDLSPEVVKVESITLSQTSLELNVDDTETIVATVLPEKAHQKVNWSSSDETVATVDENGVVTAIEEGTAIITCTATDGSGVSETIQVTVIPNAILVTDISLSQSSLTLEVGNAKKLEATVSPEEADNKEVSWSSSDVSVAVVDENGMVTAVSPGTTIITCEATDGSGVAATCEAVVDYKYLDLEAVSKTLWATMNIGAVDPADFGGMFAWGELEPKSEYTESNYKFYKNGDKTQQTKYCCNADCWAGEGDEPDNLTKLKLADDAAFQQWSQDWRMPTSGELSELLGLPHSCEIRDFNGKRIIGVKIGNRNGVTPIDSFLFLPVAEIDERGDLGTYTCYYQSSTNTKKTSFEADVLYIKISEEKVATFFQTIKERHKGFMIRPVRLK